MPNKTMMTMTATFTTYAIKIILVLIIKTNVSTNIYTELHTNIFSLAQQKPKNQLKIEKFK